MAGHERGKNFMLLQKLLRTKIVERERGKKKGKGRAKRKKQEERQKIRL